ncbi:hypothetical protein [Absidia glauca]|uniref:Reverse transcriptase domain-containing protein n=1 Tax=Absidia glauca TaxID=4829 RepID=A0A168SVB1_ABSGL|nr:hypothetical protein [Absidia glauca]
MQEWIGIDISISDLTVDIFPFPVILTEPHGHSLDYVTPLLTVSSHDTTTTDDTHNLPPLPVKCLAYADDVCILLSSYPEFLRLQHHLDQYASVSNAKFNKDKPECFSLNGSPDDDWQQLLDDHHITTYHHAQSIAPFHHLRFPMYYTTRQRDFALQQMLASFRIHLTTFATHNLSIQGRTAIANSLLLPVVSGIADVIV